MDIRSVKRFLAVAENGSLNKAARQLNISQPALSKSIQMLEYDLGVPLLDRSARGITLNSFGETVFEHGRRIAAELRRMESDIEAIRTLASGEINVGAPLGPDSRILAMSVVRLLSEERRFTVNVANGTRADLIRPLLLGDLDFLIATLFDPDDLPADLEQRQLYLDSMIIAVRAGHPILAASGSALARLAEFPWMVLTGNRDVESALRSVLHIEPKRSVLRSGSPMFVKNTLMRSDLIGLVREDSVRLELEAGTVVEIDISDVADLNTLVPPLPVGLIMRTDVSMPVAGKALIEEVIREVRRLGE
ncbi:MAG TPA: LysR family transcriptional regulator [Paracoccus sp. (in: a-proteobacteria)]|uniref:LysR family transcriptional regulator n=1 Tax=Paracoccus sp. TaxID=267 RepID=UPI002C7BC945|nr:LysR family transcriptional regulator [Paracoccus sp. (in: a-proteobacteria)]HWL55227.1 LysR family transcriptional regulator [Paracoccus sp. (in: a-proteobacteria)]